ncbi:MAG: hypothetical protein M1815_006024 [Lichina confinis]|nr:MAG: hypothetical protein M1815_006024 [Lichina confinis]
MGYNRAIVPSIFADVYRIFLWVGGKWGPPDGAEQLVEVDLLPQGAFGVPPSNFSEVVETSARSADGTTIDSSVFSVEFITKSKLRALTDRQDDKDFDDLRFLIQSYPNDINSIADRLNEDGRKNFIDEILERSQDEGFAAVAAKVLKVEKP